MNRPHPPGSITLARHGRPHADRTVRINAAGYRDWWANYDLVGLHPDETPPSDIAAQAARADIVWCSGLPRAMATAYAAAPARAVTVESLFVEAPLPPPPFPAFVRLKPPTWGVLSRLAWWLGRSAGGETRRQAEARAARAAERVVAAARDGAHVIVFAHGWFNRMLRPQLRRRGFECVQDGGDSYWSFRVYEARAGAFTLPPPAGKLDGDQGRDGRG